MTTPHQQAFSQTQAWREEPLSLFHRLSALGGTEQDVLNLFRFQFTSAGQSDTQTPLRNEQKSGVNSSKCQTGSNGGRREELLRSYVGVLTC